MTLKQGEQVRFEVQETRGNLVTTHKFKVGVGDRDARDSKQAFAAAKANALAQAQAKLAEAVNKGHDAVMSGPVKPEGVERSINGVADAPNSSFKL